MTRFDRLSALLGHFKMSVKLTAEGEGNLLVVGCAQGQNPLRVELCSKNCARVLGPDETVLAEARAEWGGTANPLLAALPSRIVLPIEDDDETAALVRVLLNEAQTKRCGVGSVISRLGEILLVRLLRAQIEQGVTETGVLAGLADPRISRAIVAMHEKPNRAWKNHDLAHIAGLSISRFSDVFQAQVGQTPQSYLRQWRMTLAHQDIAKGDRIKAVALRYGYASSEALSHAFHRQFGATPMVVRNAARAGLQDNVK